MHILTVNAGSSSIKLSLFEDAEHLVSHTLGAPDEESVWEELARWVRQYSIGAVGHRIVHGGVTFVEPVAITATVRSQLDALIDLAPLHLPPALHAYDVLRSELPTIPQVASFDTAFHATLPAAARTYALPESWRERWPIRRYGFHGLAHAYNTERVRALWGNLVPPTWRLVSCHLGAGASLCAVLHGVSVETTMGFSPLEGLVMSTRSGSIDPSIVLWLQEHGRLAPDELARGLEVEGGLVGLGGTPDMKEILEAEHRGEPRASLALSVYLHRLCAGIAAMAAAMNGIDALCFSGGVGEHAGEIRSRAATQLAFLGVSLDTPLNAVTAGDTEISGDGARVRSFVITSREDVQLVKDVLLVLGRAGHSVRSASRR